MIKWVERGVLLAAILSMLFVWPYGGIREDKKDSSLSEDYGYTEPLQVENMLRSILLRRQIF